MDAIDFISCWCRLCPCSFVRQHFYDLSNYTIHCVMNIVKFVLYSWEQNASLDSLCGHTIQLACFPWLLIGRNLHRIVSMNVEDVGNIENGDGCAFLFAFIVFILTKYLHKSKSFARKENIHSQIAS